MLSPSLPENAFLEGRGITLVKTSRKNESKLVVDDKQDRFWEDLIVYPTGRRRPSQQIQPRVVQAVETLKLPSPPTIQRQLVSCLVNIKVRETEKQTLKMKLKLIKSVLRLLKREIPETRGKDVLAPPFVSISSSEGKRNIVWIKLPQYIIPKFVKLQPSKERNKFISRQLGDIDMNLALKFRSGKHSVEESISMESLLRYLPRKEDLIFREMVQGFMTTNKSPALRPFLNVLKDEAAVKPPSDSNGDPRDFDILVRLKTGARFKVEKRYTMKGSVLRVAKGTKIEFFWSHLFDWFRDLTLYVKSRTNLFIKMPLSLFTIIIQYTVEEPVPELDFRNWFSPALPICRMSVIDKKWKRRYSQRLANKTYIKTIPKNFWALKKRFKDEQNGSPAKIVNEDIENLFRLVDGFDYKIMCTR